MRASPTGKVVWSTRRKALRALDRTRESRRPVKRLFGQDDFERSTYRCPHCGFWHLTHYEQRVP